MVEIFTDTLAPASLVGIVTKVVGLTCSGYVGSLIDRTTRVRFVRGTIAVHKVGSTWSIGHWLRSRHWR